MGPLYYESHVTFSYDAVQLRLDLLKTITEKYEFKIADLVFKKEGLFVPYSGDIFCSAKNKDLEKLRANMLLFLEHSVSFGFSVLRYKIESIVLDSKIEDCYSYLG